MPHHITLDLYDRQDKLLTRGFGSRLPINSDISLCSVNLTNILSYVSVVLALIMICMYHSLFSIAKKEKGKLVQVKLGQ
jgi:hypothetical protein